MTDDPDNVRRFPRPTNRLGNGPGDGYDDHEHRIRALENSMTKIEERLNHMPTEAFIWKAILVGATAAAALTTAIARLI